MSKYYRLEDWIKIVEEGMLPIPKLITNEWLEEQLLNRKSHFRNWGFALYDLKETEFESNIKNELIRKVSYSTLNKNYPFKFNDNIFHVNEEIKKLHDEGINGENINVAVLDFYFETLHDEIKDNLVYFKNYDEDENVHFHGVITSSLLVGKNIGICPKSKLWFYSIGQGREKIEKCSLLALNDIYEQNLKGANIRIINLSSELNSENKEIKELVEKLENQGCYIIISNNFSKDFTCINQDPNTNELYYSDWQLMSMEEYKYNEKIAIPTGGKMMPLVTTKEDYIYMGQSTYSWSIPKLAGIFALALQIKNDLTYDEFVSVAHQTKKYENGICLIDVEKIIQTLKQNYIK